MTVAVTSSETVDIVLAVFLVVLAVTMGYAFWRLGTLFAQLRTTTRHTEAELLPVLNKTGGTLDRVNNELDKVDVMTDSAVDAVTAVDRTVRAVTAVVTAPVQALAGVVTAVRYTISSFLTHHDLDRAVKTGREAGERRVQDIQQDLDEAVPPRTAPR